MIENYSGYPTRRADVTFGIDYDDDMDKAIAIIRQVIDPDSRILRDPEPFVKVVNLGDSSVDIASRSWVQAADYWDVKFHLTKAVKEAFDREGISIPYPHQGRNPEASCQRLVRPANHHVDRSQFRAARSQG